MQIDLYGKSQQLLEILANSIYDRDLKNRDSFSFNITEIHLAEKWLKEFVREVKRDCICL